MGDGCTAARLNGHRTRLLLSSYTARFIDVRDLYGEFAVYSSPLSAWAGVEGAVFRLCVTRPRDNDDNEKKIQIGQILLVCAPIPGNSFATLDVISVYSFVSRFSHNQMFVFFFFYFNVKPVADRFTCPVYVVHTRI